MLLTSAAIWPRTAPGAELAASEQECWSGLIYVGDVLAVPRDQRLEELVSARIAEGIRFALDAKKARSVVSLYELTRLNKDIRPAMIKLNQLPQQVPTDDAFLKLAGLKGTLSGYVRGTILQSPDSGSASAEIQFICLTRSKPGLLVKKKVVRTPGHSADDRLLQAVFRAAGKLVQPEEENHAPIARITGGAKQLVAVGKEIAIDAAGSSDEDYDALDLTWTQETLDPSCSGWREEGTELLFRSSKAGVCKFMLVARELVARFKKMTSVEFEIETLAEPVLSVAENTLQTMSGRTPVTLKATCEHCDTWQWIQVSGPVKTIPRQCNGEGPAADCSVDAPAAGEFSFALIGRNALTSVRKEYTVGVAPPPIARAFLPERFIAGHWYTLDGSSSHDVLGGALQYHWEISQAEFTGCDPVAADAQQDPSVRLTAPTSASTGFLAQSSGRSLHVRLTVLSSRKFGDRAMTHVACTDDREIPVVEATWLPWLAAGGDYSTGARGEWDGSRLSLGVTVRHGWPWLPDWLAFRAEQNVVRNDGAGTRFTGLGGTFVGVSWLATPMFHPYLTSYLRAFGGSAKGVQAGADVRVQRYVYMSGGARYESRTTGSRLVLTGLIGIGYDL